MIYGATSTKATNQRNALFLCKVHVAFFPRILKIESLYLIASNHYRWSISIQKESDLMYWGLFKDASNYFEQYKFSKARLKYGQVLLDT